MNGKIRYGNSVIVYSIVKSRRRKTSEIRVGEEGVEIRTPKNKTNTQIKKIVSDKKRWIFKKQLEFKDNGKQRRNQIDRPRLFEKAKKFLPRRMKRISAKLGIKPKKIIVKSLKNRWGSTTKEGIINLNYHLIKAPKEIIDYIMIHELCHLKVKEHNRKFWRMVEKYDTDFYAHKKWLDKNGIKIL